MMDLKRPIAALLLATTMPACMATHSVSPQQYLSQNRPSQMLVMDHDGAITVIQNPHLQGENVVGVELGTPDTVAVPVSQVTEARVKVKSPKKTALLVGGLTAGITLGVIAIATAGGRTGCAGKAADPTQLLCPDSAGNVFSNTRRAAP